MAQSGQSEGADSLVARAHHGSVSKEQRSIIEDDLKRGRLPCVVATSSLELGIDMGAVDLVVQIESPPSVASALQRVGRAGHQVGEVSRGVLFPKHRGDLVPSAVTVERMRTGGIEALHVPANPLDVLAQQVVAATSMDTWDADNLFDVVRRSAPFATLPRSAYDATLDLLSGRYPSDEFAELRPRLVWDRVSGELSGRPGAQRLAVTSGGTIPDRGLFGVFLVGEEGSPGRRARRGDGLRVPGRRRVHAGHHDLAHRGHHPRPGARLPRARATGSAALLDRRHPRPARRARRCGRSVHPRGLGDDPRAGHRQSHRRGPRRVGRGQPGLADRGAEGGHPGGPPRPAARGRALPRRARRLAPGRALPLRHAGALPVGAGDRRSAARALRGGRPGDGHRRRHRAAHPRDRPGPAGRRADRLRARRARADRHHRGRRVGAVRLPLPGVRCAGAAAAAPRPRSAGAAVAAAPALRAAARGRRPLPVVPDHPRDRPRGAAGSLRPAVAGGPAPAHLRPSPASRRREHPAPVSVRAVAAVRLRRRVHVRGRLPHRRAPRRRAHPRPGTARRAPRPRRAARAARPRGARRGRVRAPAARRGPAGARQRGHRRPAAACWDRSPPRRSRLAAPRPTR